MNQGKVKMEFAHFCCVEHGMSLQPGSEKENANSQLDLTELNSDAGTKTCLSPSPDSRPVATINHSHLNTRNIVRPSPKLGIGMPVALSAPSPSLPRLLRPIQKDPKTNSSPNQQESGPQVPGGEEDPTQGSGPQVAGYEKEPTQNPGPQVSGGEEEPTQASGPKVSGGEKEPTMPISKAEDVAEVNPESSANMQPLASSIDNTVTQSGPVVETPIASAPAIIASVENEANDVSTAIPSSSRSNVIIDAGCDSQEPSESSNIPIASQPVGAGPQEVAEPTTDLKPLNPVDAVIAKDSQCRDVPTVSADSTLQESRAVAAPSTGSMSTEKQAVPSSNNHSNSPGCADEGNPSPGTRRSRRARVRASRFCCDPYMNDSFSDDDDVYNSVSNWSLEVNEAGKVVLHAVFDKTQQPIHAVIQWRSFSTKIVIERYVKVLLI